MYRNSVSILFILIILVLNVDTSQANNSRPEYKERSGTVKITSPNGYLEFETFLQDGHLMYKLTFQGKAMLEASRLGLVINGEDIGQDVSQGKREPFEKNETCESRGKHSTAKNHFRGVRIAFTHDKTKIPYTLEVRVFDEGVAFRYTLDRKNTYTLTGEATTFKIPAGSAVWYHGITSMHYEEKHQQADAAALKAGEWIGPPITFRLPDGVGFASITESGIITASGENFPGMAIETDGLRGFRARLGHEHPENYPYVLRYKKEDHQRLTKAPTVEGEISSPWRVVLVGRDLNALVNSDVIHHVAPEPDPKLFSQRI